MSGLMKFACVCVCVCVCIDLAFTLYALTIITIYFVEITISQRCRGETVLL